MRKLFTILVPMAIGILVTASVLMPQQASAQPPEKMSYQAVIRDASDNLVTEQQVGMQISILQGTADGTAVYVETQTPTTNSNGLVSLEIGTGTTSDDFSTIDWANGPYFIKTETDPTGGASYTITGTSQLLSVPYAIHAKTAETYSGTIAEEDPVFSAWDKDYADLINPPTTITTTQANAIADNSGKDTTGIYHANRTALDLVSGTNTGDQDISGIATNEQAIQDTASQIRDDIPDVSGFLTSETDPQVGTNTLNYLSKWDGSALVSSTIFDNGNVGIGTDNPASKLTVAGTIESTSDGYKFPDGTVQTTAVSINSVLPSGMIVPFAGDASSVPEGWLLCDGSEISRTAFANLFSMIGTNYGSGDNSTTFNLPDLRGMFLRGADAGSGNDPDATSRTASNPGGNTGDNVGSQQTAATGLPNTPFSTNTAGSHNHSGNTNIIGNHSHSGSTNYNGNHNHNILRPQGGAGATWDVSSNYINKGLGSEGGYPLSVNGTALNTNATGNHNHTFTTNTTGNHSHNLLINNNGSHTHSIIGGDTETRPINVYVNYIIKY